MLKRILIADDEPNVRRMLRISLESKGYEVAEAGDGRQALAQLDAARPDLIILDVGMPFANGYEVLEVIRASPDTRAIPVIMVTGQTDDGDIVQGWRSGTDCYLGKPVDMNELMVFVERMLIPDPDEEPPVDRL